MKTDQIGVLKRSLDEEEVNCTNCYYSAAGGEYCWRHKFYLSSPENYYCEDFLKTGKKGRMLKPLFGFKALVTLDM